MLYSKMAKKWIYIPTIFLCIMLLFLASISYAENSNITLSMNGYKQTTSYTCGSASSLMVLYYCGQREALETSGIKRDEDFHNTYRVDKRTKGIQMADIAKGINNFLGQDTYSIDYYVASVDDLINTVTNSLKLYRPVIASVYWYGGHYVVIYGIYYENGTAYFKIKDPAKTADQVITKKATEFYN